MRGKARAVVGICVALLGISVNRASGAAITIEGPLSVRLNDTFQVVVGIEDVNDLYAYQLLFVFNEWNFEVVPPGIVEGPFLGDATEFIVGEPYFNEVAIAASRLGIVPGVSAPAGAPGTLFVVTLRANAVTDPLDVCAGCLEIRDVIALDSNLGFIEVEAASASVPVVVPEPVGLPLVALAAAFAARRLRKRAAPHGSHWREAMSGPPS